MNISAAIKLILITINYNEDRYHSLLDYQLKFHEIDPDSVYIDENMKESTPLLMAAVKAENLHAIKKLLGLQANINIQDHEGCTPLMFAIDYQKFEIFEYLLQAGADIEAKNHKGTTALRLAAHDKLERFFDKLIESGANINVSDVDGQTVLMHAIANKESIIIKKLIALGTNLDAQNNMGDTATIQCAFKSQFNTQYLVFLDYLIQAKADIHIKNNNNLSALMYTARNNCVEAANFLINAGASNDDIDASVLLAQRHNAVDVQQLLTKKVKEKLVDITHIHDANDNPLEDFKF